MAVQHPKPNNPPVVNIPTPAKTPGYYAARFAACVRALLAVCFWATVGVTALAAAYVVFQAVLFFVRLALSALGIG